MDWSLTQDLAIDAEAVEGATEADEATRPAPLPTESLFRVAFVGGRPTWLDLADAAEALEPFETLAVDSRTSGETPAVVQVGPDKLSSVPELRRMFPGSGIVVDLTAVDALRLGRRAWRALEDADLVLVASLVELRELRRRQPSLTARSRLLREPVDLDRFAPEAVLAEKRGRDLRRHRREHRLVAPAVLFAGPYTEVGGLDLLLEAVYALREEVEPALRLCAVPLGPTDQAYLDRIERRALRLGHHAPIQWTVEADDLPLWFACADVVCLPTREPLHPAAASLAAAAGTPYVGSDLEQVNELVGVSGANLVPAGNVPALVAALGALVGDADKRALLGREARLQAEQQLSPTAAAARLRQLWADAAAARV